MMFTHSRIFLFLGLGALVAPILAQTTIPYCGDEQNEEGSPVSCKLKKQEWECPPFNDCGSISGECFQTFRVCLPSDMEQNTKPPKTSASATTTTTTTGSGSASVTPTGSGAAVSPSSSDSAGSRARALMVGDGLGLGLTVAVVGFGVVAGGLIGV